MGKWWDDAAADLRDRVRKVDEEEVYKIDTTSEKMGLAIDMLTGKDEFCVNYLQAYRDGRLQ
mgnify:CR=1 FL=1